MGEALTFGARREPGFAIVTVGGEIDIATVTRLREGLAELAATGCPLVADLNQVRFIDSAGLSALVGAAKDAAAHGGSLHVVCARPTIRSYPPDRAGPPDTAGPHPRRGPGGPGREDRAILSIPAWQPGYPLAGLPVPGTLPDGGSAKRGYHSDIREDWGAAGG